MKHGNYRRLHYTSAITEAEASDEILVTKDDVLMVNEGHASAVAIHIVTEPNFWEHDRPKAFEVQLVRPNWLYGAEGLLFPVRWVGHVDEMTEEEIASHSDDDPVWDLLPEHGSFLWAVPKVPKFSNGKPWKRCEFAWFDTFRTWKNSI